MRNLILMMLNSLFGALRTQAAVQAEIIALRHQLIVLQRTQKNKRLALGRADRWFWVWLSQLWSGWRSALIIVEPETVLSWHRKGFRWYWTWKIRHGRTGRPSNVLDEPRFAIGFSRFLHGAHDLVRDFVRFRCPRA
jgi:hypothetical protein